MAAAADDRGRREADVPARLRHGRADRRSTRMMRIDDEGDGTDAISTGSLCCLPLPRNRSEEHTSELQSLMRTPYAVFSLKKHKTKLHQTMNHITYVIN